MKYISTRGGVSNYTFEDTILSGYASDGGLFLPCSIPKVSRDVLESWSKLSYPALVKEILPLYISEDEIGKKDLFSIVDKSFHRFTAPDVLEVARLKNGLNVLEMFHGPTMAFKDISLACVGQLLDYFLTKRNKHSNVIVVTSGDTGSAVIEALRGMKSVDVLVTMPGNKRCSRIQELQMTTVIEDNIHIYRVNASSDDMDTSAKRCFLDQDLVQKHDLASLNSVNWSRVMVQIVAYFYCYFQLDPDCDGEVEIICPTGGCGNISGGIIARAMGLPIRLVSAVNPNDIMVRILTSGDFSLAEEVKVTIAPSMDIQMPLNMERIFHVCGMDCDQIRTRMNEFEKTGRTKIPEAIVKKVAIDSCSVSEDEIRAVMQRCWSENGYLLCPHSATAVCYHYKQANSRGLPSTTLPRICMATASPVKFEETVRSAGLSPEYTPAVRELESMPTSCVDVDNCGDLEMLLRANLEEIHEKLSI